MTGDEETILAGDFAAWSFRLPDGFLDHILERSETDCLLWKGRNGKYAYGRISLNGSDLYAHRVSYEAAYGPIAAELEIDHVCRNGACVNPSHLQAVTHRENIRRGVRQWQKCPHGDAFRYARNRTCNLCRNARRRKLYRERRITVC